MSASSELHCWRVFACMLAVSGCTSLPLDNAQSAGGDASSGGDAPTQVGGSGGDAGAASTERIDVLESVRIVSDLMDEQRQNAEAEVNFSEPVARATLRLTLESPCFPFDKWATEGVAKGERWPAPCDAFDRAISVTLDPSEDSDAAPAIELMRAITPFGGPLEIDEDITDVVNGLPGKHRLRVMIDTESDPAGLVSGSHGEWIASAALLVTPGAAPRHVLAITPIEFGLQTVVDASPMGFTIPEGAGSARLEYRATGHGQADDASCIGPAEEFCQRPHTLTLDGSQLFEQTPWRMDCVSLCTTTKNASGVGPTSYCAENPCGDPRSVRAPRANWCPGSRTPAFMIEDARLLEPGDHELGRRILGLKEGGFWRVSATYFAFE